MKKTLKRQIGDLLRGALGMEGFDKVTLAVGLNAHFNSNLEEMKFFRNIVAVRHPSPMPLLTLIDAGANRGLWSEAFCRVFPVRAVHLFEPNPKVAFKFFTSSAGQVYKNLCGVSSSDGSCDIRLSNYPGVTSSIGKDHVYDDSGGSVTIPLVSIDSYFERLGADPESPTVLKVDVEGHDMEALQGANGLFARRRINYVLIEIGFNPADDCHSHFLAVHEFLAARGFAFCGFSEQFCVVHGDFYGFQWGNAIFSLQEN